MSNTPIYISTEVYTDSHPSEGLYEEGILCHGCSEPIGAWQFDTLDSTVETFTPYWMHDMDNNHNLCEVCHKQATLTFNELAHQIAMILPYATFGEDNDGQILIYTDMTETADGRLVPFQPEED